MPTFPCLACGAPVEPLTNKTGMPCPYCGSALTIPVHLRTENTPPPPPKAVFDPIARARAAVTPEMRLKNIENTEKATGLLRKIEPTASKAYRTYAWLVLIKYFTPTCLAVFGTLCFLAMVASGLLFYFIQNAK